MDNTEKACISACDQARDRPDCLVRVIASDVPMAGRITQLISALTTKSEYGLDHVKLMDKHGYSSNIWATFEFKNGSGIEVLLQKGKKPNATRIAA